MEERFFADKNVVILGMGISGRSAAEFLLVHGASVCGIDRDPQVLATHPEMQKLKNLGLSVCVEKDFNLEMAIQDNEVMSSFDLESLTTGGHHSLMVKMPSVVSDSHSKDGVNLSFSTAVSRFNDISRFDFMIISPGVPLSHPLVQSAQKAQLPIMGEIELGCRVAKSSILGITGTNGKTTVTMLVKHILSECGYQAKALGNVGIPFTRELLNMESESEKLTTTIVLELSSYQIETLYQPCLETAIILNITPDHLDRYLTMEAYAKAKFEIARALKPEGHLYVEERTWKQYGDLLSLEKAVQGDKVMQDSNSKDCLKLSSSPPLSKLKGIEPRLYGYSDTCYLYTDLNSVFRSGKKVFDLPLKLKNKKSHDLENMLAAYALCADKGISGSSFIAAWETFKKPAHRIEFVAERDGIRYYDDSKGTNIDAVIRAVEVLEGPIVLIAGGVDKGAAYTSWIEAFKGKVKLICAIGQAAGKIDEQLGVQLPVMLFNSLDEAVHQAARSAQKGDAVLLSPGCSSFDMFKDYVHRGNEFQRIVRELV